MDNSTLIGFLAGTLTTISLLPQLIKTWKSKSTKDISLGMFVALSTGILLWVIYGFEINSMPVIITNIISFFLSLMILILKIIYR